MGLGFLANLLSALPGTVVYHLLVCLGLLSAAGILWTEWRHTRNADLKPYLIAVGGTLSIHLLSVVIAPTQMTPATTMAVLSAPFLYAGELLSVLLLVWAFGQHLWRERAKTYLITGAGVWLVLWLGASIQWAGHAANQPITYNVYSWQVPVWYALTAIAALTGAGLLLRSETRAKFAPMAFILLGIGAILGGLGSQVVGLDILRGEGWGRLCLMVGYPLFAIALFNSALQDLEIYRHELQELSQEALRQSQELLFLIEATRSIGERLDLGGMLGRVADSVAMALRADTVAILLSDEASDDTLTMVAWYQVLGGKAKADRQIKIKQYPVIAMALRNRQLSFDLREENQAKLRPLFDLINVHNEGPVLIQPLTRQERTMGVLIACNDSTKTTFSPDQKRLATTIGVQIAGAVENSRLYRQLEGKALELSRLLKVRETELRREEAILESMAEGILVSDARGKFILLNRAAEEILAVDREHLINQTIEAAFTDANLRAELDPQMVLELDQPLETSFSLEERRLRVHAAPVLLDNGERLGVVSILQDITREHLAEESKREFIASISHELRTPLTAIKGYTEVMLSGMAGELPPAFHQFLGVIRENTTRMAILTDNIISVAEIERGRLGLNYRSVHIPDLIHETVKRYTERITERPLTLKLDLPEDMPEIEVDPNRLRLILDNLMSNAVKFTYPDGEITIGCRGLQGSMGQPTYVSVWISDTGVGIPSEEHAHIWERFYRVDSPLSLEAGGLGIGLTITKALVEVHGGRVWVDSTVDQGSTFTVLLPTERGQNLVEGLEVEL